MSHATPNPTPGLRLHGWRDPVVIGVAAAAMASGFGQFGVVAALGDVARTFGQVTHGASLTDQAGLSGTELGIGLAVIRLSAIGALPLAGLVGQGGTVGDLSEGAGDVTERGHHAELPEARGHRRDRHTDHHRVVPAVESEARRGVRGGVAHSAFPLLT